MHTETGRPTETNRMHVIKHNGEAYLQDIEGVIVELTEYMRDLGPIHNPHAVRRLPGDLNSDDPARTCPHCRTAYRASDQRDPDRCPYCWRLI